MNKLDLTHWPTTTKNFPTYIWFNAGKKLKNNKTTLTWLKKNTFNKNLKLFKSQKRLETGFLSTKRHFLSASLLSKPFNSRKRYSTKKLQFLHPGKIWTVNNLEGLTSLPLLGKGLKTTRIFFEADALFDNKIYQTLTVPSIIKSTSKWVRSLSNLVSDVQTKQLTTFLNLLFLRLENDELDENNIAGLNHSPRVRSVWKSRIRSKLNLQPYAFIGIKHSFSRNKSRELWNFTNWRILKQPGSSSSLIYPTSKTNPHWTNSDTLLSRKSKKNFNSWKAWIIRTLRKKKAKVRYKSIRPVRSLSLENLHTQNAKQVSFYGATTSLPSFRILDTKLLTPAKKQLLLTVRAKKKSFKRKNKSIQYRVVLKCGLKNVVKLLLRPRNSFTKWFYNSRFLTLRKLKNKRKKKKKWLRIVHKLHSPISSKLIKLNPTPLMSVYTQLTTLLTSSKSQKQAIFLKQKKPSWSLRINTRKRDVFHTTKLTNLRALNQFTNRTLSRNKSKLLKSTQSLLFTLPNLIIKAPGVSQLNKSTPTIPTRIEVLPRIFPQYAKGFTRSPFFFISRAVLRNKMTDVVSSIQTLQARPKYLVFPDANDLKVSIFRKLNKQKNLAYSRLNTENLLKVNSSQNRLLYSRPNQNLHLLENKNYGSSQFQSTSASLPKLLHFRKTSSYSQKIYPRIRRIRFKPGYGRIWRAGRKSIREILGLHHRYQYRLSPKLQLLYSKHRQFNNRGLTSTTTLGFSLMTCRFAPDSWTVNELLNSGTVFLNGVTATNTNTRLFMSDFLQLIIHLKYYIALKWVTNFSTFRKNRVSKIFYRKFRPSTRDKEIKVVRTLPTWFYDLQYAFTDVPRFFEVDYFTLSIFMIHDDLPLEKWTPSRARLFDPLILNMYNWKYIT